jgi:co-chaperonin GroES (HSP10)
VEPIITTLTLEERARKAGLEIVVERDNVPKPTVGKVIALGGDPLMNEEIKEGNVVFFHWHAGHDVTFAGVTYRQLEHPEVTGVMTWQEWEELEVERLAESKSTSESPASLPVARK